MRTSHESGGEVKERDDDERSRRGGRTEEERRMKRNKMYKERTTRSLLPASVMVNICTQVYENTGPQHRQLKANNMATIELS